MATLSLCFRTLASVSPASCGRHPKRKCAILRYCSAIQQHVIVANAVRGANPDLDLVVRRPQVVAGLRFRATRRVASTLPPVRASAFLSVLFIVSPFELASPKFRLSSRPGRLPRQNNWPAWFPHFSRRALRSSAQSQPHARSQRVCPAVHGQLECPLAHEKHFRMLMMVRRMGHRPRGQRGRMRFN